MNITLQNIYSKSLTLAILVLFILPIATGLQSLRAQKLIIYMEGKQVAEYNVWQLDSITFVDADSSSGDYPSNDPDKNTTLWEYIKNNNNYSRFADIAQHAKVYKDDTHAIADKTYADILNSGQVSTVWVPNNDAFTEEEYQKLLGMCTSGSVADGYRVHHQLLGNHIALWRHNISEVEVDTVKMINGKNLVFVKNTTNPTFGGIPLGEYNKSAVNGVMHVLKGIAPFHYNFYEYLKYTNPQTKFGKYVVGKDTTYFNPSVSVEGLPDENGNPTYVDSVFSSTNRLFEYTSYLPKNYSDNWQMADKGFGARINNEDSVFVMLLPTDEAWDAAYEKLKLSYNYATAYDDKSKGDLNVTNATIKDLNADSLQKMSLEMDMVAPLVFNIHKQPKKGGSEMWTVDMFKEYKGEGCEYLLNTYGDTLRAVGDWKPSDLFNVNPIDMSNGIAYEVTSWNFPKEYYTPDVEVEIEGTDIFYNKESNKYKVGPNSKKYTFSNDAYREITDKYGKVSNNNFYHLDATGPTSAPKVEIKILGNNPNAYVPNAQVMSGKYDVQVVVVPRWYMEIVNGSIIDFLDDEKADSAAAVNKYKFRTQISYNVNAARDKTSSWVTSTYDGLKVDTITVAEDFEFPYSYKNMRFSYPTLVFEGYTSMNDRKNGFVYDIVIDKIILKRKEN